MKVFKFGGASVRHANAIQKVAGIVGDYKEGKILIVVSAMGKTTNALERVLSDFKAGKDFQVELSLLQSYHEDVMRDLFPSDHPVWKKVREQFKAIPAKLTMTGSGDQLYDQVVSTGELLSSIIVSDFLQSKGFPMEWIDIRKYIETDATHREANVDWARTEEKVGGLQEILQEKIILTQGFIAGGSNGFTTTLGREGSDYSAAILASCLGASSVTIWKDVPGVMNADPKRIKDAKVFEELPFREAAEMTYYGATVIHPKTIKPLANKNIPLLVKNFDDPTLPGTIIHETTLDGLPPLIVFKENQCLVSCHVNDYTFINEEQLSFIFHALSALDIKLNMMQNSAISFSFCVDFREDKIIALIDRLAKQFEVYYNTGLTLITVKNYDSTSFETYRRKTGVILEQSSRSTLQILVKN